MRPRNKFEKAVLAESRHLHPISKRQLKWAFRECVDHYAYRQPKGRTTCMDCGHTWQTDGTARTCTCPHCKARLQVKNTLERKLQNRNKPRTATKATTQEVQQPSLFDLGL